MLAAIRVRGKVGVKAGAIGAMASLKLDRKNTCVVVEKIPSIEGALRKAKDYITWGELDEETAKLLAAKKSPYNGGVKTFRLQPPLKGFRSIKQHYPKGALGYRGAAINELIKRMVR